MNSNVDRSLYLSNNGRYLSVDESGNVLVTSGNTTSWDIYYTGDRKRYYIKCNGKYLSNSQPDNYISLVLSNSPFAWTIKN